MSIPRLLLFSNSTNSGEEYLSYTLPYINTFLGKASANALFIPYAGISLGFDGYYQTVNEKLKSISVSATSIHDIRDKKGAIRDAEIIITGGGNTFYLLKMLQEEDLLDEIVIAVKKGSRYIGWSAGANLACPTICTTNDMPIVQTKNLNALNLIPFQINPHYTDFHPPGHAGETRETRIMEYILVNQNRYVAGLREGSLLRINGPQISLLGKHTCRIFRYGKLPEEKNPGENLDFLMQ